MGRECKVQQNSQVEPPEILPAVSPFLAVISLEFGAIRMQFCFLYVDSH